MHFRKFAIGAVVLACALAVQPAAATIVLSGEIQSYAAYTYGNQDDYDWKILVAMVPGTFAVNSSVSYNGGSQGATISVESSVDATWYSPDSGSMEITWGWDVDTRSPFVGTYFDTWAPSWSYNFIASQDGFFTLDYSLTATGYSLGLLGFLGSGGLDDPYLAEAGGLGTGTSVVPLTAGQSYSLGLYNVGNLGNSGGVSAKGSATGVFDWAITYDAANPVPEPASWAMMIGGLAFVGASMRRRARHSPTRGAAAR